MHKPSEWDTRQGQTPDTLPPVTLQPGLSELGHPLSRPGHPQPGRWGLAEPRHGGGVGGCPTQFGERPVSPGCWEDQVTSEVVCEMRYKERGMSSRCTGCTCHGAPAVAGRGEHEGMCAAREPTGVKAESPPGPDPGTVSSSAHPHPPPSPGLPGSPSESHPNPARRGSPGQWVSVLCPPCRQPGQRESCPARSHGGGARHPADMGAGLRLSPLGHHCQGSLLGFGSPGRKDKKRPHASCHVEASTHQGQHCHTELGCQRTTWAFSRASWQDRHHCLLGSQDSGRPCCRGCPSRPGPGWEPPV